MKKMLLVWNAILTVLLLMLVFTGCETSDTRINWLVEQAQLNTLQVETLKATVDQNRQLIQTQAAQIIALQSYIDSQVSQIQALLAAR